MKKFLLIILTAGLFSGCGSGKEILNVSYDPTRELYAEYNEKFKLYSKDGEIVITQSHGGSGKQAQSVIDGMEADVVTLALAYDVMKIEKAGLIDAGWESEFPTNSSPYTSTIVFLVRKDNPKNISDWADLVKDGVEIVMPNPKTSGAAQWGYLAAWEVANRNFGGDENKIRGFMKKLFENVVALDSGARGSTTNFVQRQIGDVLIAWENEALLSVKENPGEFEIITPSLSILAEPSVAVVDKNVDRKGTRKLATEYIKHLYSYEGQEIAAQNFYRPRNEELLEKYKDTFKPLNLFTIDETFSGWQKAYDTHFADGAIFDQIYK